MLKVFVRTVVLYTVITMGLRLMGKRQMGELELSEVIIAMMISDMASTPLQDLDMPLVNGIISALTLLGLSLLLSLFSLKSLRFRQLFCGHPTLIIRDGRLMQRAMRRNRFTIDELVGELRVQGVTDLTSVQYAILETNGQLSLLLKTASQPLTAEALGLPVREETTLPVLLINDGRLLRENFEKLGLDGAWLAARLAERGLSSPGEVFFLSVDGAGSALLIEKETRRRRPISPRGSSSAPA